jgi:hypothetical protein
MEIEVSKLGLIVKFFDTVLKTNEVMLDVQWSGVYTQPGAVLKSKNNS